MRIHGGGSRVVVFAAGAWLALAGSGAAQEPVKLEYQFPEGSTLRYRTTWNASQTVSIMGMEIQSRENKTVVRTWTAGKRRGDSTLPVAVKVESLRAELRLQGGIDLTFDSKKPDAKLPDPDFAPLAEQYKLEGSAAYTVVLDKHNQVKAVEGTEKLLETAGKLDAIAREQIRGRIEPDRLKAQFEQDHRNLPDGPTKPGASWERTELADYGGQSLSFRKKYEYAGTEKKDGKTLDKIAFKVLEVTCQPPGADSASPLKVTKSDLKVESSEGTILFDREAGRVVESRERTKIKGRITASGGGADTSSPIDLTLRTETRLQPETK